MYKMPAILEILMSHPVENLRKEIAKTNIKGYAKASKKAIVEKMLLHSARFQHIKMYEKKADSQMLLKLKPSNEPKKPQRLRQPKTQRRRLRLRQEMQPEQKRSQQKQQLKQIK